MLGKAGKHFDPVTEAGRNVDTFASDTDANFVNDTHYPDLYDICSVDEQKHSIDTSSCSSFFAAESPPRSVCGRNPRPHASEETPRAPASF